MPAITFAFSEVVLKDDVESISLVPTLEYLVDESKALELGDILSGKHENEFIRSKSNTLNLGLRNANYWLRFTLKDSADFQDEWLLVSNFPLVNRIDLYIPQPDGGFRQVTGGLYYPPADIEIPHRNHIFRLQFPANEPQTYYMRYFTESTFLLDLQLQTKSYFQRYDKLSLALFGIVIGVFLALALHSMLIFISLRDVTYLLFVFFILIFLFYQLSLIGLTNQFLWPQATWWALNSAGIFAGLTILLGILFARRFLQTKSQMPRWDKILLLFSVLSGGMVLLVFISPLYANVVSAVVGLIAIFLITSSALYSWLRGYKPARFFSIAWLLFILGGVLFVLTVLGIVQPSILTLHSMYMGFAFGVIVLSIALDARINLLHMNTQERIREVVDQRTRQLDQTVKEMQNEIDERKRIETALRESRNLFQIAFLTSPDSVNINRLKDGVYVAINEGFTNITGYSEEDVIGISSLDLNIWASEEDRNNLVRMLNANGYVLNLEAEFRTKAGKLTTGLMSARIIDFEGEPHILSITRDISERKAAEMALAEKHCQLLSLVKAIPDIVYFKNMDGQNLIVNQAFADMLGGDIDNIIGKRDDELMPADLAEHCRQGDQIVFQQRRSSRIEEQAVDDQGGVRYYDTIKVPIFDSDDQLAGLVGVSRDITERKEAEIEKQRLEEQLQQSQKMEAIGRLAGGVAHDFNNILTGIIGYAEMVLNELPADHDLREEVEEILRAADRAASLIQQLLAFSRKQIISPKVVQLNNLIRQAQKMLVRIISEDITFSFQPAKDLWPIKIDSIQIDQILVNLAANARDAMAGGGTLRIHTENATLTTDDVHDFPDIAPGNYVVMSVSDTGKGMDEQTRERIFEPFFSTKDSNKGTGLGLSTVYGVVKQNGGFIRVNSQPGKGTTFHIYFPGIDESLTAENPVEKGVKPHGSETILVVEDEKMVRQLVQKILTSHGYNVLVATNGLDALEMVRREQPSFDMLLTDVIMPQINGKDLYRQMRRYQKDLKVLYMSGYTEDVIAHHGVLETGTQFLQKPFTLELLLSQVREVLDYDGKSE